MKKFAVRAMIVLAVVVALALFLSGTVRTLTTPKVRFLTPRQGKFEQNVDLTGKVVFPEEEDIIPAIPEGTAVSLLAFRVQPGDYVHAGDPLFTASVQDLEKTVNTLQKEYDTAREALRNLKRKSGDIRLSRNEQAWLEASRAVSAAARKKLDCRVSYLSQAAREGLKDAEDTRLPEDASGELKALFDALIAAEKELENAEKRLSALGRYALSEEVWTTLTGMEEQQEKMKEAEQQIIALTVLARSLENYPAPHDGYVTALSLEKGASLDAATPVLKMTPEGSGAVLRADISQVKLAVSKGAAVTAVRDEWSSCDTKVTAVGITSDGSRCLDAKITEDILSTWGSMRTLMKNDVKMRLTSKAKESSCLIPATAVRGSGTDRYVYVASKVSSTFGGTQIRLEKTTVTVLNESASTVSVSEDLSYQQVVYQEDRPIDEKSTVMAYSGEGGD